MSTLRSVQSGLTSEYLLLGSTSGSVQVFDISVSLMIREFNLHSAPVRYDKELLNMFSSVASPIIQSRYANIFLFIDCEDNQFLEK